MTYIKSYNTIETITKTSTFLFENVIGKRRCIDRVIFYNIYITIVIKIKVILSQ